VDKVVSSSIAAVKATWGQKRRKNRFRQIIAVQFKCRRIILFLLWSVSFEQWHASVFVSKDFSRTQAIFETTGIIGLANPSLRGQPMSDFQFDNKSETKIRKVQPNSSRTYMGKKKEASGSQLSQNNWEGETL
jgi:hypothetical protein